MVEGRAGGPRTTPGPAGNAPVRIPRSAYAVAGIIAVLFGWAATVRGTSGVANPQQSDLTTFFFPAASQILSGHPWEIYSIRAFGGYPNYNPPISIFLMAPLLALAHAVGVKATDFRGLIVFVSVPFLAFVVLMGYATVVALRRLFPGIPETQRFLAFILVLFGPLTWQTFTTWYHIEQPMMLALLIAAFVAFQARREELAGALAGLAVLSRTTAIVPLIAFGALLLLAREWRALLKFGGVAGAVVVAGLAPFVLFDRADTVYSLSSWRGAAEIGGNAIWSLVKYDGTQQDSPLRYALDHVARRLDMYVVIVFVAFIAWLAVSRLRISAYSREAWAVLAIATLAIPMLSKNNWPYYYLEPFLFIMIWEFSSMHDRRSGLWRWPLLTVAFLAVTASLSQFIGLQSVGAFDRIVVGLLEFGTMAAFVVAVWYRAGAARPERAEGGVTSNASRTGAPVSLAYDPGRRATGAPDGSVVTPNGAPRGVGPAASPEPGWPAAPPPGPRTTPASWEPSPAGGAHAGSGQTSQSGQQNRPAAPWPAAGTPVPPERGGPASGALPPQTWQAPPPPRGWPAGQGQPSGAPPPDRWPGR